MCRVLQVSRSGFYDWCRRPPCRRAVEGEKLTRTIRTAHAASRGTYGAPRIAAELRARGVRVSTKRVARLMRAARLQGVHLRRRPPQAPPREPGASDLVSRSFSTPRPDHIWASDITYLRTGQGWAHLAVVLDLHSRRVVGWQIAPRIFGPSSCSTRFTWRSPGDDRLPGWCTTLITGPNTRARSSRLVCETSASLPRSALQEAPLTTPPSRASSQPSSGRSDPGAGSSPGPMPGPPWVSGSRSSTTAVDVTRALATSPRWSSNDVAPQERQDDQRPWNRGNPTGVSLSRC